jgi:hypothetical protein
VAGQLKTNRKNPSHSGDAEALRKRNAALIDAEPEGDQHREQEDAEDAEERRSMRDARRSTFGSVFHLKLSSPGGLRAWLGRQAHMPARAVVATGDADVAAALKESIKAARKRTQAR